MKKLLSVLTVLTLVFAIPVQAEEKNAESDVSVTFSANDESTGPVDPTDPDKPGGGTGTGNAGPKSIDYISTFSFGDQKITGKEHTYNTTTTNPYIQVSDKSGDFEGWRVSARLSEFTQTGVEDRVKHSFNGTLTFNYGESQTTSDNSTAESKPDMASDVEVVSGSVTPVTLVSAKINHGIGTWVNRWFTTEEGKEVKPITLTVDTAQVKKGTYTATLTVALENAQ